MSKANFKDQSTGLGYHVTGYSMKGTSDGMKYFDGEGNELLGEDGSPLISLPFDTEIEAVKTIITSIRIGYGAEMRSRDVAGAKAIAKKHNRSADAKHTSWKNATRELKNK